MAPAQGGGGGGICLKCPILDPPLLKRLAMDLSNCHFIVALLLNPTLADFHGNIEICPNSKKEIVKKEKQTPFEMVERITFLIKFIHKDNDGIPTLQRDGTMHVLYSDVEKAEMINNYVVSAYYSRPPDIGIQMSSTKYS